VDPESEEQRAERVAKAMVKNRLVRVRAFLARADGVLGRGYFKARKAALVELAEEAVSLLGDYAEELRQRSLP
jgi:hypothetical protein